MKKLVLLLSLFISTFAGQTFASSENLPPLMIIRFSEAHVDYKHNLSMVMQKASKLDSDFKVNITGHFIENKNYSENKFKEEMDQIIQTIADSGIRPSNISVNVIKKNEASYPEVIIERNI